MTLILISLLVLLGTGLVAGVLGFSGRRLPQGDERPECRWPAMGDIIAAAGVVLAGILSAVTSIRSLVGVAIEPITLPWAVPLGAFALGMDPLSAWFVLALAILAPLSAVFGVGYLAGGANPRRGRLSWLWFNLLVASILLTLTARNGVLFLAAWEAMTLSSFFLVMHEYERESVRDAGWTYLVASHIGTAFLFAFFVLLGKGVTMDFAAFVPPVAGGTLFLLALVGFGTKAGFIPLHVWLPEAHPAAPSHVSALMSGVMIKTGIYGLLRALEFLGAPCAWWGWTLLGIGATTALFGVILALAQRDLKRLLAYSSVENVGIIAVGLGLGLLGACRGMPAVAALGFAGALFHVLNHAFFKGLLFLGAGAVRHATGTAEIERLGGLLKRMPVTGATFLIGSAAISALPPLGGFVGEFLILLGAFRLALGGGVEGLGAGALAIGSLALVGGLAVACFTRAAGVAFLGEPRSGEAADAHEGGPWWRGPLVIRAAACFIPGFLAPFAVRALAPVVAAMPGLPTGTAAALVEAEGTAWGIALGGALLAALAAAAFLARASLLRFRRVSAAGTWDCGYAAPTARMQYTASSFGEPLTGLFRRVSRPGRKARSPEGLFPSAASFSSEAKDVFHGKLFAPIFRVVGEASGRVRWLQHGRTQLYVLYVALTALILLVWKLR